MKNVLILLLSLSILQSCKVYSFTGASINPEIKTISVQYIYDRSGNGPAFASDVFTNVLKNKMLTLTSLSFVNSGGDVQFSGVISGYNYSIQAPSGDLSSDLRRITMQVQISYLNTIEEENSFETLSFSRYEDYPVSDDLGSVEEAIIQRISEQLVDDIFNKAFVNW